jgi:hypothetical protein
VTVKRREMFGKEKIYSEAVKINETKIPRKFFTVV